MNGIHRIDRRGFLRTGTGALLAAPLVGLYGRQAMAQGRMEPIASPYGPVRPVADATTGLELLQLPEGFTYQSYGWAGDPMDDGAPTPLEHDGMAVVRSRDVGGEQEITLIRNHESKVQPLVGLIGAPAAYDANEITDDDDLTGHLSGGTTRLIYRGDRWVSSSPEPWAGPSTTAPAAPRPGAPGSPARRTWRTSPTPAGSSTATSSRSPPWTARRPGSPSSPWAASTTRRWRSIPRPARSTSPRTLATRRGSTSSSPPTPLAAWARSRRGASSSWPRSRGRMG